MKNLEIQGQQTESLENPSFIGLDGRYYSSYEALQSANTDWKNQSYRKNPMDKIILDNPRKDKIIIEK